MYVVWIFRRSKERSHTSLPLLPIAAAPCGVLGAVDASDGRPSPRRTWVGGAGKRPQGPKARPQVSSPAGPLSLGP